MAKRKAKAKRRTNRQKGISVLGVAETIALANVATQTAFNVGAYDFMFGGMGALNSGGFGTGNQITLRELFNPIQTQRALRAGSSSVRQTYTTQQVGSTMDLITENLKANWVSGVAGMIFIPLGFKIGKQVARPAISRANRLLGKAGIAKTVKV